MSALSERVDEMMDRIGVMREQYHVEPSKSLSNEIYSLMREIAQTITNRNAVPCVKCSREAHGLRKNSGNEEQGVSPVYEIGCLECKDHRVRAATPERAINKWNKLNAS